jgi:hypothetical protein
MKSYVQSGEASTLTESNSSMPLLAAKGCAFQLVVLRLAPPASSTPPSETSKAKPVGSRVSCSGPQATPEPPHFGPLPCPPPPLVLPGHGAGEPSDSNTTTVPGAPALPVKELVVHMQVWTKAGFVEDF